MSLETKKFIKELVNTRLKPSQIYRILKPLPRSTVLYLRIRTNRKTVSEKIDQFLEKWDSIKACLNGNDLKKIGISSGKRMGIILNELLYRKMDGEILTRQDEIKFVKILCEERGYGDIKDREII